MRRSGISLGFGLEGVQSFGISLRFQLPSGLEESSRLPEPIFTPATKAETGHDINISFERACADSVQICITLRDLTLTIYNRAAEYAETRGIIIADTKFEFGFIDGSLCSRTRCLHRIHRDSGPRISTSRADPAFLR